MKRKERQILRDCRMNAAGESMHFAAGYVGLQLALAATAYCSRLQSSDQQKTCPRSSMWNKNRFPNQRGKKEHSTE